MLGILSRIFAVSGRRQVHSGPTGAVFAPTDFFRSVWLLHLQLAKSGLGRAVALRLAFDHSRWFPTSSRGLRHRHRRVIFPLAPLHMPWSSSFWGASSSSRRPFIFPAQGERCEDLQRFADAGSLWELQGGRQAGSTGDPGPPCEVSLADSNRIFVNTG